MRAADVRDRRAPAIRLHAARWHTVEGIGLVELPVDLGVLLGDLGKAPQEGRHAERALTPLKLVPGGDRVADPAHDLRGQAVGRDEPGAVDRDVERDRAHVVALARVVQHHAHGFRGRRLVHPHRQHVDVARSERVIEAARRVDDDRRCQAEVLQRARVLHRVPRAAPAGGSRPREILGRAQAGVVAHDADDRVALMERRHEPHRQRALRPGVRREHVDGGGEPEVGIPGGDRLAGRRRTDVLDLEPVLGEQAARRRRERRQVHAADGVRTPGHETHALHSYPPSWLARGAEGYAAIGSLRPPAPIRGGSWCARSEAGRAAWKCEERN